jgi:hypothetical protein
MVGAINAPATGNTFDAFKTAAINTAGTQPGVRPMSFYISMHIFIFFSFFLQQGVGFLVGIGASASAPVGDVPTGVSTFGEPTPGADTALASGSATASGSGSSASGSTAASGSASAATTSTSSAASASHVAGSSIFALFAAVLGLAMA